MARLILLLLKLSTQELRCSNLKSAVYIHDSVLLRIFYEGVACTIKSRDIIY